MAESFSVEHIICLFENRNFEELMFRNGCVYIDSKQAGEIIIEAPDDHIPDEVIERIIDVLQHLDDCSEKAHRWIRNVKIDLKKYPHALDKGFIIYGMYFGKYCLRSNKSNSVNGFGMTFTTVEYYPLDFTVWFYYRDRHPIALEAWGC